MDPNQRLVNFASFKITDYLKKLLENQSNISHGDSEFHAAAYNALLNAESTPAVINRLREDFKKEMTTTPPPPPANS